MSEAPASPKPLSAREKIARLRLTFLEQLAARQQQVHELFARLQAQPADQPTAVDLHRALHSLKGTGSSFGFRELGVAAGLGEDLLAELLNTPSSSEHWLPKLAAALAELDKEVAVLGVPTVAAVVVAVVSDEPSFSLPVSREEVPGRQSRMIYLCDDETLTLEQLASQLSCFGYETRSFIDPQTLHEAVLAQRPDALVLDINFPHGHSAGTDMLSVLNCELAGQTAQPLPAIFLSSRNDFEARLNAVQAGGMAYFHKPARPIDLVTALDALTRQQPPEPYRILVVDDEPEIASYHSIILQEAGMLTYQVNEPSQLLEALQEFRPDMVLMDMYMPVCSGRDLAQLIRQVPDYVGLPIVYLSSETDRQKQYSAMRIGAEGFLTKPVVPENLVAAVGIRAERMRTLRSLMARDSLTGLFNHTTTTQLLANAILAAKRANAPLSFVMIDIDRFKSVNDTHGHPAGDQVLLALSRLLQQRLRQTDVVGRYGGEEFAVILPGVLIEKAVGVIDELRRDFSRVVFDSANSEFSCTFSAGIASVPQHQRLELLREAADKALYEAKRSGRNRVVMD